MIDLREIVDHATELIRGRADGQHVTITIHRPIAPCIAPVDRNQVCSVLVNLFINALDAMPQGGELTVTLRSKQQDSLNLTIADTGPGISHAVSETLFTPFQSTKPTGTGLGLSICRRIVEDHGGSIAGGNAPDGGARFELTLPRGSLRNNAATRNDSGMSDQREALAALAAPGSTSGRLK